MKQQDELNDLLRKLMLAFERREARELTGKRRAILAAARM